MNITKATQKSSVQFCPFLFVAFTALIYSCGDSNSPDIIYCTNHVDCPGEMCCSNGVCKEKTKCGCKSDLDCPEGQKCLPEGTCKQAACISHEDCEPGLKCVNYQCRGNECQEGQTQTCYIGCHEGKKDCVNGVWQPCDAEPISEEKCADSIDNDCDGETDEDCKCPEGAIKNCETICGKGKQVCQDGIWLECDAPTDCICDEPGTTQTVPCGNCGEQSRICGEDGKWQDWGPCMGEGVCEPGQQQEQPCGLMCGKQTRICQEDCTWSSWSQCADQGICTPGEKESKECGNCGIQERICGQDCMWEPWGECIEGQGCKIGDIEEKPCGNCGTMTRQCLQDCKWGPWSQCQGEGVCAPGTIDTQPCGKCGTKDRTCTMDCTWSNWSNCKGEGECNPGDSIQIPCGPSTDLGICQQGIQTQTCNANCQWNPPSNCVGAIYPKQEICGNGIDEDCDGKDKTAPDQYEPNNSCSSCYFIDGTDPDVTLYPTFDSLADTDDYFCFYADDGWNLPFTSEHIIIELKDQPVGVDGDIFLYKGYQACIDDNPIASSITIGGGDEKIDWQETGDNDTGTYYVRVQNWSDTGKCYQSYTLHINGLK